MRAVDLDRVRIPLTSGQVTENQIKNTQSAPSDEAVVERPVRAVLTWRITPAKTIAQHMDDAGDDTTVIGARNSVGQGKMGSHQRKLTVRQPKQI